MSELLLSLFFAALGGLFKFSRPIWNFLACIFSGDSIVFSLISFSEAQSDRDR